MANETRRQLIHISGILFVLLAQFLRRELAVMTFLIIAILFLLYAELIRREHSRFLKMLKSFEPRLRTLALGMERTPSSPFRGAMFFYLSAAMVFAFTSLPLASAAVAILAIGDGFATMVGSTIGRFRLIGEKSVEGTLSFFVTSLIAASFFVPWPVAAAGAAAGAVVEALLGHPLLKPYHHVGMDDNLLIPLAVAVVMSVVLV